MSICGGITLFNPEIERLKRNIEAILPQVEFIYFIDNNSKNIEKIKDLLSNYSKIELIENPQNFGIAKALNQICEKAKENGFKWALLLDQDSIAEEELIKKYSRYTEMEKVAIITPYFDDENEPDIVKSRLDAPYELVNRCNTSASLVNVAIWEEVGGFDEEMFIDCVDFDYCTTAKENGYVILRDNEAVLYHRLGEAQEIRFFMPIGRLFNIKKLKKPLYTYNHPPIRTYYYARNIKYYTFKHKKSINRFTEWRVYVKWLVLKLCFEKQRYEKLKAIIKGRKDARKMIKEYKAKNKNCN